MSAQLEPSVVLNLVTRIQLPPACYLHREFPILSIICATDDARSVVSTLREFSPKVWALVKDCVQYAARSSIYPHAESVWPYNNYEVSLQLLSAICAATLDDSLEKNYALDNLCDDILLHEDTFPFVDVAESFIDPQELRNNPVGAQSGCNDQSLSSGSLLVPGAVLGSLFFLAKTSRGEPDI